MKFGGSGSIRAKITGDICGRILDPEIVILSGDVRSEMEGALGLPCRVPFSYLPTMNEVDRSYVCPVMSSSTRTVTRTDSPGSQVEVSSRMDS